MKFYVDDNSKKNPEAAEKPTKTSGIRMDTAGARLDSYGQGGFRPVGCEKSPAQTPKPLNSQPLQPQPPKTNQQKQEWKKWMPLGAIAAALVLVLCLTLSVGTTSAPKVNPGNNGTSNAGTSNKDSSENSSSHSGSSANGASNSGSSNGGASNGGVSNNGANGGGNAISDTEWRNNVMSSSGLDAFKRDRTRILSVTFYDTLDYVPTNPDEVYYLGTNASHRVQGWIQYEGKNIHLHIAAEGGVNVKLCTEGFFEGCEKLEVINFNGAFHTEEATSMRNMFNGCSSLYFADFSNLDTSNVTDMYQMFRDCSSLTAMDVYGFDTSKVTNMSCMFSTCTKITELDLSSFDTSNVTNMSYMFSACKSIKEINTSSFNTSKVTNMTHMFRWCDMLDTLYLGGWDFSHVTKYDKFMNDGITINGRPWEELFA